MEKLVTMMAFCEAPLDCTVAPSEYGASTTGGCGNVVALLDAAAKEWPKMDKLVATMAFCEAPLDGTFDGITSAAPSSSSSGAAGYGVSALTGGGGGDVVALLAAAAKKCPVERVVASMAFCEAPLDGTCFDGTTTTSAPSSSGATTGGKGASGKTNVPEAGGGGGGDAAALRREWLAGTKKEWPLREHPLLLREKAGSVVDGLAIFETVALE